MPFSAEDSAHIQDHYTLLERQIIIEVRLLVSTLSASVPKLTAIQQLGDFGSAHIGHFLLHFLRAFHSLSLRGSLLSIVFRHPFSSHLLLTWKYFPELHFITISLVFLHPTWAWHHFLDFKLLWAILGNSFSFSLLCLFPRVGSTTAVILKASLLPLLHGHCPFFHLAHATTGK